MASVTNSEHHLPHAGRVSLLHQAVGVAAAPTAWAARLLVNLVIASSSCLPGSRQKPPLNAEAVMLAVDAAALIVAVAAAAIAYRDWRSTTAGKPGSAGHALEIGEGRTRFLALSGIMVSSGFALATIFDLTALLIVPLCSRSGA